MELYLETHEYLPELTDTAGIVVVLHDQTNMNKIKVIYLFIILFHIGLTLELYLETHEYLPELTDTAGIVVVLHDQNNMPLPDEEGILIPPGFETRLGVRRVSLVMFESHIFFL